MFGIEIVKRMTQYGGVQIDFYLRFSSKANKANDYGGLFKIHKRGYIEEIDW
jgi:hypothetical protein